jgi:hypothetical protein
MSGAATDRGSATPGHSAPGLEEPQPGADAAAAGPPPGDGGGEGRNGASQTDPRVEDALSRLAEIDGLPLAEHVAVFADIHQRLEAVLADPESRG